MLIRLRISISTGHESAAMRGLILEDQEHCHTNTDSNAGPANCVRYLHAFHLSLDVLTSSPLRSLFQILWP